jgi:amino acid adenylation domain-containing protein
VNGLKATETGAGSFLEGNLCQLLLSAPGERTALIDGRSVASYEELTARALGTAEAVTAAGARPGDRVAILAPRGRSSAAAYFGVLAAGAVAVMLTELLKPRQLEYVLRHSGASLLLADRALLDRLPRRLDTSAGIIDIDTLPASDRFEPVSVSAGDVAQIIYTSGSTGRPKGVTLSHANLWAGTSSVVSYLGISRKDRIAALLPFSFDYGLNQLLCATATGATLVIERSPIAARIVRTLADLEVSVVAGVPPLWLQLLQVEAFIAGPLPTLRVMTNSGGRLPVESVRRLRRAQPHADLVLMYGLTEAFRSTFLPPDRVDDKPGSIGWAIPGAKVMVLDGDGRVCAPGEVGEIAHRGPTVALGYWQDPEAAARVFRRDPDRPPGAPYSERVVFSGDLGYQDEEGHLFFVGREDTMIKTLGYRVSPDEVAEVLHASGEVAEAAITSEPETARGARIVAHVVLAPDGSMERLEAFAARELPRYMQPARIVVRDSLERTASGKHDPAAIAQRAT